MSRDKRVHVEREIAIKLLDKQRPTNPAYFARDFECGLVCFTKCSGARQPRTQAPLFHQRPGISGQLAADGLFITTTSALQLLPFEHQRDARTDTLVDILCCSRKHRFVSFEESGLMI